MLNYFDSVYNSLSSYSEFLNEEIYSKLIDFEEQLLISGISMGLITLIVIYLFIILTIKIKEQRENALFLFLDIP